MGKANFPVQLALLETLFALPSDCHIVSIHHEEGDPVFHVIVEGSLFPESAEGEPLAHLRLEVFMEHHPDNPDFRKVTVNTTIEHVERRRSAENPYMWHGGDIMGH
jgi:hypothetical protein